MILILLVYMVIGVNEWRYLRRKKRKKRTYAILLSTLALLFTFSEVLYAGKERFQLSIWIEALFGPLEHWIIGK
jgi:membrane-anchored protein YejM (alkaline phosphatase superfamily)